MILYREGMASNVTQGLILTPHFHWLCSYIFLRPTHLFFIVERWESASFGPCRFHSLSLQIKHTNPFESSPCTLRMKNMSGREILVFQVANANAKNQT